MRLQSLSAFAGFCCSTALRSCFGCLWECASASCRGLNTSTKVPGGASVLQLALAIPWAARATIARPRAGGSARSAVRFALLCHYDLPTFAATVRPLVSAVGCPQTFFSSQTALNLDWPRRHCTCIPPSGGWPHSSALDYRQCQHRGAHVYSTTYHQHHPPRRSSIMKGACPNSRR